MAVMLVTWLVKRTVSDAIVDNSLAKKGIVSPRMEGKHGASAAAKVEKYGFFDFLRDAWNDYWPRRTDALIAARDAKAANPGEKVRLRDRLAAAKAVVTATAKKVAASPVVRKLVDPVERKPQSERAPDPAVEDPYAMADPQPGTRRFTDTCVEEWDGCAWRPVEKPASEPAKDPVTSARTAPAGGTMSAPTGEAVNYETAVAELEAIANEQRGHVDQCQAALVALEAAKSAIGDMQESYRASAAAVANLADHLAAKNLDAEALANAGTAVDAMPAGRVDEMFDQIEGMEQVAKERLADAEIALAATEANLKHIQETLGDADNTVNEKLGGDPTFLGSGGAAAPAGRAASGGSGPVGVDPGFVGPGSVAARARGLDEADTNRRFGASVDHIMAGPTPVDRADAVAQANAQVTAEKSAERAARVAANTPS